MHAFEGSLTHKCTFFHLLFVEILNNHRTRGLEGPQPIAGYFTKECAGFGVPHIKLQLYCEWGSLEKVVQTVDILSQETCKHNY